MAKLSLAVFLLPWLCSYRLLEDPQAGPPRPNLWAHLTYRKLFPCCMGCYFPGRLVRGPIKGSPFLLPCLTVRSLGASTSARQGL